MKASRKKFWAILMSVALVVTSMVGMQFTKTTKAEETAINLNCWKFSQAGNATGQSGNEGYINSVTMNDTEEVIGGWLKGSGSAKQTQSATQLSNGFSLTIDNTGWDNEYSFSPARFNPWSVEAIMPSTSMQRNHRYKVSFKAKANRTNASGTTKPNKKYCYVNFKAVQNGVDIDAHPYGGGSVDEGSSNQVITLNQTYQTFTYYFKDVIDLESFSTHLMLGAFNSVYDYEGNDISSIINPKETGWKGVVDVADFSVTDLGEEATTTVPVVDDWYPCHVHEQGDPEGISSQTYYPGNQGDEEGVWKYLFLQNNTYDAQGRYKNADAVQGFTFEQQKYSWDGAYFETDKLKSLFNLTEGTSYKMNLSVSYEYKGDNEADKAKPQNLQVILKDGNKHTYDSTQDLNVSETGSGTTTFSGDITVTSNKAALLLSYGQVDGDGTGAYQAQLKIESISFEETTTTTGEPETEEPGWFPCHIHQDGDEPGVVTPTYTESGNGVWTYQVLDNEWGNMAARYKNAEAVEGFTYNQKKYGWDGAQFLASGIQNEFNIQNEVKYDVSVVIRYDQITDPKMLDDDEGQWMKIIIQNGDSQDCVMEKKLELSEDEDTLTTFTGTFTRDYGANVKIAISYGSLVEPGQTKPKWEAAHAGTFSVFDVSFDKSQDQPTTTTKTPVTTTQPVTQPSIDVDDPVTTGDKTTWDCIYFGNYMYLADANTSTMQPIKWRVLDVNGNDAFVMADQAIDCIPYNNVSGNVTWATNTYMDEWFQDFFGTAFTADEQDAIIPTTVSTPDNPAYPAGQGGDDTTSYIYLPSIQEMSNASYGFPTNRGTLSARRRATATPYAIAKGAFTNENNNAYYWLRTPGATNANAATVTMDGEAYPQGNVATYNKNCIRPVMHIDLSKNVYTNAGKYTINDAGEQPTTTTTPAPTTTTRPPVTTTPVPTSGASGFICTPVDGAEVSLLSGKVYRFASNYYEGAAEDLKTGSDIYYPTPLLVTWNAQSGATNYSVKIGQKANLSDGKTYDAGTATSIEIEDLNPGEDYYYQVTASRNSTSKKSEIIHFTTANLPKTISIDGVGNTRDIGGCYNDGAYYRVKHGLIYRGANLDNITEEGKAKMLNDLGIKTELDLREYAVTPPLGPTSNYIQISGVQYSEIEDDENLARLKQELLVFTNPDNYPIYFHCNLGRDRTGTLAMLVEGILGMTVPDIRREFELTYFSKIGCTDIVDANKYNTITLNPTYNYIHFYGNGTFQENCIKFAKEKLDFTDAQIKAIQNICLEQTGDIPESTSGGHETITGATVDPGTTLATTSGATTKPIVTETTTTKGDVPVVTTTKSGVQPIDVVGLTCVDQGDSYATITWQETPAMVALNQMYYVYVDGYYVDYFDSAVTKTYGGLAEGEHTFKVTSVYNGIESTGKEITVNIKRATTEAPSVVPTSEEVTTAVETTSGETGVVPTTKKKVAKPAKVKIKKIYKKKRKAKKLKIKIKKAKGAIGYQFKVFKKKKNAKKVKKAIYTKTFKKYKKKFTLKSKKLKKKKKLFVRVRAYNFMYGKTGKKQYGKWSAIKKVKVKR